MKSHNDNNKNSTILTFLEISEHEKIGENLNLSDFQGSNETISQKENQIQSKNLTTPIKKSHFNNFLSFLQNDADFYALVKEKLNDEDLKQITKKKLKKNMTCIQIDDLLKKCELLIDFIENREATKTLSEIMESLDVVKDLLNKIVELEGKNSQMQQDPYQGFF